MSKTGWLILAVVVYLLFFHGKKGQAAPSTQALSEDEIAEKYSADGLGGIPAGSPLY